MVCVKDEVFIRHSVEEKVYFVKMVLLGVGVGVGALKFSSICGSDIRDCKNCIQIP